MLVLQVQLGNDCLRRAEVINRSIFFWGGVFFSRPILERKGETVIQRFWHFLYQSWEKDSFFTTGMEASGEAKSGRVWGEGNTMARLRPFMVVQVR